MNREKVKAVFAWLRDHQAGMHVTFGAMLVYVLSVTGLAVGGGTGFLCLNVLSGLWCVVRLYLAELCPVTSKDHDGLVTAILSPEELIRVVNELSFNIPPRKPSEETGET